jgi:hypothetical protein
VNSSIFAAGGQPNDAITAFAVAPMFDTGGNISAEYNTFNVASSNVATTLTFNARTTGTGLKGAAIWSSVPAGMVTGATNTGSSAALNNIGTVNIPANHVGDIVVTVTAADCSTRVATFTLNVRSLANTVAAVNAPSGTFIAGDRVWRVLSKTMGATGHDSGTDILILQEHIVPGTNARWNPTNSSAGGWNASEVRNVAVKNMYENSLQWAHSFTVKPGSTNLPLWDEGTNGTNDTAHRTELTTSTGTAVGSDTLNGAFLLSYRDFQQVNFGFTTSTGGVPARGAVMLSTTNPGTLPSTRQGFWMRTSAGLGGADVTNVAALSISRNGSELTGIRPAMLLNLS